MDTNVTKLKTATRARNDVPPSSRIATVAESVAAQPETACPLPLDQTIKALLIESGKLNAREFDRVSQISNESSEGKTVASLLVSLGMVSEKDMAKTISGILNLPRAGDVDFFEIPTCEEKISARFLKERCVIPTQAGDGAINLVMADPTDQFAVESLTLAFDKPLARIVGLPSEIESSIEQLYGDGKSAMGQIVDHADTEDDDSNLDVEQLKDMASGAPVIRLVNMLLQRASDSAASDIHIEPFEGRLKVRYRIDGVLHDVEAPPSKLAPAVISRIKIMAKLNIAERRLPQDGRIKLRIQGRDIDARVSTIPTMYGESVVMRLLNRGDVALDLASLGFNESARDALLDVLRRSNGMILVTGPTGSGKTTTLYTAIHILNTEQRKIITAEDPVEYQMEGVNQIQVKPAIGLTFSNVLRSIVRQDPDVILVGEMRDLETARICIQSALTGHLVLSTLHTNSAASSVTRLLEMGIEDYLVTSTLNAVVSQRLVRVLCTHCREAFTPSAGMMADLKLDQLCKKETPTLYRPVGCCECNDTGYRGRQSILELLVMSDEVRKLIQSSKDAKEIETEAINNGMRTIYQDGCEKALAGITSIEEVLRVIQEG
jgi:general secretion pathway protein E